MPSEAGHVRLDTVAVDDVVADNVLVLYFDTVESVVGVIVDKGVDVLDDDDKLESLDSSLAPHTPSGTAAPTEDFM